MSIRQGGNIIAGSGGGLPNQAGKAGKFLTTDGTNPSWAEVQSMPDTDNKSINVSSQSKLQTIGVIDQNHTSTALKQWVGTLDEYNALTTKDNNTLYNITDDGNPTQALLEAIYPVGSIYIGTMNVCPLAALFGTWEKVAEDRVLQGAGTRGAVGTTLNESLPNYEAIFVNHWIDYSGHKAITPVSGAIAVNSDSYPKSSYPNISSQSSGSYYNDQTIKVSPSLVNTTYQDNAPVQQNAFLVNIWRRTA